MQYLHRPEALGAIERAFDAHPAVALVGPRQAGKTTLAHEFGRQFSGSQYFDLERPLDVRRLSRPESTLSPLEGLVVIDEIQRKPELFELLRYLLDRPDSAARFLLLGSASPSLVRGVSETLAGRIGIVDLGGFNLREVGAEQWRSLWTRGGFPRSFLAATPQASASWRDSFIRTFLERDVPQLGLSIPAERLRRFWSMIAHFHGQVWNGAEFSRALGTSEPTARSYLDILSGAYMVRVLPAWFENLKKRQLKAPKIYVRDSGLLHSILEIDTLDQLQGHPKIGASFEGFVIEQIVALLGRHARTAHFWGTHGGAELDIIVTVGGVRHGFEIKLADAPGTTRSMRAALSDLHLEHLWVVYPGSESYDLDTTITVTPVALLPSLIDSIRGKPE